MSVVNINKELFRQQVEEEKKVVLAEFWAPWCVYCRRIGPAYKKIAEEYGDKLVIGQINIDEEQELAVENNIEKVYMAAMLDPHTGAELSVDDIVKMCDELIEAHNKAGFPCFGYTEEE